MQAWVKASSVALSVGTSDGAVAQDAAMLGRWCLEDGSQSMLIESGRVGLNEHTVCEPQDPFGPGAVLETVLLCKNFYFNDGQVVEAFARTMPFKAELESPDSLRVVMDDDPESMLFERCE